MDLAQQSILVSHRDNVLLVQLIKKTFKSSTQWKFREQF